MSRDYDYINISRPQARSRVLSHDLQLERDLQIANARTVAELGLLPPSGLPVVPKPKFIPSQSAAMPARAQANFDTQEEKAMKLSQMVTVTALVTGIAACKPSSEIETAPPPSPAITHTSDSQVPLVKAEASSQPKEAAVTERAIARAIPEVPNEIRAFVPQDSTLLAYKRFDLTGDGNEDAVLILHHPTSDEHSDSSKNPCDLVVLHSEGSGFKLAGKSSKAVDCTYRQYLEGTNRPDDLNYMLELNKREIACNYEADRPMATSTFYTFKYSTRRNVWYMKEARHAYKSYDSRWRLYLAIEEVKYPNSIGFIKLDEFDPEKLRKAFNRNREIEYMGQGEQAEE